MTSKHSIQYGNKTIYFQVISSNRKTIEIAVYPDSNVIVKAPVNTDLSVLEKRIRNRASWIRKQQDYFEQFEVQTTPRSYIGGETHLYLGRQYRLKISEGIQSKVMLTRGFFMVTCKGKNTPQKVKRLMDTWYRKKAAQKYEEYFKDIWQKFQKYDLNEPKLKIRRMKTRWGSLSKKGNLTLNIDLIRAPKECIEYVITHELCHLKHHDHGTDFYNLLEKLMPDWKKRKHKLELALV